MELANASFLIQALTAARYFALISAAATESAQKKAANATTASKGMTAQNKSATKTATTTENA